MSIFTPLHFPGRAPSPRLSFSPAVQAGNIVWISGLTATNEALEIVGPDDIAAQTRFIFQKMEALLVPIGASLHNIVETTDYVTTWQGYERTAAVRREMLGGPPWPAAAGVLVAGLIRSGALIEIKATAVLG